MHEFGWQAVAATLGLGTLQILLGGIVGWWLKARRVPGQLLSQAQARLFLARLHDLATAAADDLGKHAMSIEEISHDLITPGAHGRRSNPESVILDTLSQLVMNNRRLHSKLMSTERQFQEEASKIDFQLASARMDDLTKLPNRRAFDDELEARFLHRQTDGKNFSLMFLDLDHLRRINDDYGHDAGDRLLRHVGNVLTATMRDRDFVVRYCGGEFAVILGDAALPEAMRAVERALRALRETPCLYEGKELRITASAGVAETTAGDDLRSLIRRADAALSTATEAGGNTGYFHDGKTCHPILVDGSVNAAGGLPANRGGDAVERRRGVYAQYVAALGVDARTDVLTGLPNRRAFGDELRRRVAESRKSNHPLSLMLVGVDDLARISAFQGQDIVDEVLRKVAQVLCAVVRDSDLVTRFGWEEFAVILPATNFEAARKAHGRAQAALAACMQELSEVTISSGLAELVDDDDSANLSKRAEAALAKAKFAGGNCSRAATSAAVEVAV